MNAGAEPAMRNHAGHDAVYEAERSGREEVVRWLLIEGRGLERGVTGGGWDGDREEDAEEEESGIKGGKEGDGERGKPVGEIENGMRNIELGKEGVEDA